MNRYGAMNSGIYLCTLWRVRITDYAIGTTQRVQVYAVAAATFDDALARLAEEIPGAFQFAKRLTVTVGNGSCGRMAVYTEPRDKAPEDENNQ